MNPLHQDGHGEDELSIREYYQLLRGADPAQREAILYRWQKSPFPPGVATPSDSRMRIAAVVIAMLVLVTVSALWEFRTPGTLYGADDLPARLVLVDNFRMTGWQNVPNPGGVNLPPTKLPFELTVQRPGRYRHTFNSISESGDKQTIVTGSQMCDGRYAAMLNDTAREYLRYPVSPLDALLTTEQFAQGAALMILLGPPDSSYERVGREPVKGVDCDLYVASHGKREAMRLWIDPQTGWPVRIVVEMLNAAGKWAPMIEIDEIVINGELPDSLFTLSPPEGYVDLISKLVPAANSKEAANTYQPLSNQELPELSMQPTGGGGCNDQSLNLWHGFLLRPDSALVVWKRTMPKATEEGLIDWMTGMDLVCQSGKISRPLQHHWVRPPQDKQWLWSIIKTADGQPFGRGTIQMTYRSKGCSLENQIVPLLLPDSTLDRLLQAAQKIQPGTAPGNPLTVKSLRDWTSGQR